MIVSFGRLDKVLSILFGRNGSIEDTVEHDATHCRCLGLINEHATVKIAQVAIDGLLIVAIDLDMFGCEGVSRVRAYFDFKIAERKQFRS